MKFRNPWIDPRVAQVRPEQARAYLLDRGWRDLGPAANPNLVLFEGPGDGEDLPAVLLPLQRDEGPMLQRMIELIGEVALFEGRGAARVLDDVLRETADGKPNKAAPEPPSGAEATTPQPAD
jgi:hypothetical protein